MQQKPNHADWISLTGECNLLTHATGKLCERLHVITVFLSCSNNHMGKNLFRKCRLCTCRTHHITTRINPKSFPSLQPINKWKTSILFSSQTYNSWENTSRARHKGSVKLALQRTWCRENSSLVNRNKTTKTSQCADFYFPLRKITLPTHLIQGHFV